MATQYMGSTMGAAYLTNPAPPVMGGPGNTGTLPSLYSNPTTQPVEGLARSRTTMEWRPNQYHTAKKNSQAPTFSSVPRANTQGGALSRSLTMAEFGTRNSAPSVVTAARQALYTKYSPNEWQRSNMHNYFSADKIKSVSEKLRLDSVRLAKEMDERIARANAESGKRIGDRIKDIEYWRSELGTETNHMNQEISNLSEAKRVLEKALRESENPMQVAQECLFHREKRQGIDMVHDNVERALITEVETIKKCQDRMRHFMDKANNQLNLNRGSLHELELDNRDKFVARGLDSTAHGLANGSRGIAFHDGIERLDRTRATPETWAEYSHRNVRKSQSERANSTALRNEIEQALEANANDMWNAWNNTNSELARRSAEGQDARNKIQHHLSQVQGEIFDMEQNVMLLTKAITDKQAPLKVAQSRLEVRTHRPGVEATRDPAQARLTEEVYEVYDSVEQLRNKLNEAENALQHLQMVKSNLEHDLSVKNNSIFLDREKCLGLRKSFPMAPRVVCY